ncbi:ArsR/SmtB family transcription factor [Amycolatopsis albispora]|uniref:ArsR family transcriptional regulator n=1 Tax=Amycolatopsis albispora TaxID=1804986 RepID=A0A344LKS4_9PSEU|nr:helix-turn-helix domain-containing protein [Amycolatopsis albispora]AXB48648.1 ArsR family transcriptional regulator [Amycolatopsis albispora]
MTGELAIPPIDEVELGTVLAALADPHRRRVVLELARGQDTERACASFALPKAKSTRTHHWRVLRGAGLIRQRDAGNGTFVRLRDEFENRFPGLLSLLSNLDRGDPPLSEGR